MFKNKYKTPRKTLHIKTNIFYLKVAGVECRRSLLA